MLSRSGRTVLLDRWRYFASAVLTRWNKLPAVSLTVQTTFTRRDVHRLLAKIAATRLAPQPDGIHHRNSEREY
jgi:hypothetical protein